MKYKKDTRHFGEMGEEFAVKLLKKKGYKILERNFQTRLGEIDIVAIDPSTGSGPDGTLVFVEVKTRWSEKFGKPEEAVTPKKLSKIKRTGEYYSLTHSTAPKKLRIDVVALEVEGGRVTSAKIIRVD